LYFAFASIDPTNFMIKPAHPEDELLYPEFTALQREGLQTWIAIGGFDFSDSNQATHTTWSDMVSQPDRRAHFIQSVIEFMERWNFQGVDIDWEYPVEKDRGGREEDAVNLVKLMREMRQQIRQHEPRKKYGLSMVIAPDYWYLRHFDVKSLEPEVDWFGFMAYDLHGFWDKTIPSLASNPSLAGVRPHTDMEEIRKDLLPLSFAGIDMSKVNFGLAYYARGYTLEDRLCNHQNCPFSGPNRPGNCTDAPGVLSIGEILEVRDRY
jgi:chitinase